MAKSKKIVKYRKSQTANMGVVIFFIIFLYMCYNLYDYFTEEHVSIYEVQTGEISQNTTYTGLILRDETIYNSEATGYINYYRKDASKVAANSIIYTVDGTGEVAKQIAASNTNGALMDSEARKSVEHSVNTFISAYDDIAFYNVYTFKTGINAKVKEDISLAALDNVSEAITFAQNANAFVKHYAPQPGVITYYTDGYEGTTVDNFRKDSFQEANYAKKDLRKQDQVESGNPVYKLLTNENWNVVIPINDSVKEQLQDKTVVETKFIKDGTSAWANFEIQEKAGNSYLVLHYKTGMVRFANDRFLDLELQVADTSGLKIPNSSIVKKECYRIPKDYFYKDEETNRTGLRVQKAEDADSNNKQFIAVTPLQNPEEKKNETESEEEQQEYYYVDCDTLQAGDTIYYPDASSDTYTVGDTKKIKGVYNINKGYAVFCVIDILYQTEEYTIISPQTAQGVTLYDYIALDGTTISDGALIH